ncbi:MAG: hypothetical protein ACYS74_22290 [Planctomycetota bacterium]|jgi:hypothetical protein
MIPDKKLCFTYAYSAGTNADWFQDISGAEEVSTNAIDLDVAGIKIAGGSKPPWLIMVVGTAADACVTMEIKFISSTAAALNAGVKVLQYFRFTQAQLAANALIVNQPLGHWDYQQYIGWEFTPFTNDNSLTVCSFRTISSTSAGSSRRLPTTTRSPSAPSCTTGPSRQRLTWPLPRPAANRQPQLF